eukprot:scaffold1237_cov243-Pinguiococcus_pyrenoidosus.AAC.33
MEAPASSWWPFCPSCGSMLQLPSEGDLKCGMCAWGCRMEGALLARVWDSRWAFTRCGAAFAKTPRRVSPNLWPEQWEAEDEAVRGEMEEAAKRKSGPLRGTSGDKGPSTLAEAPSPPMFEDR